MLSESPFVAAKSETARVRRATEVTDAPYMTPVPHRGHRNDSSYISYVAEAIAEARGLDAETVSAVTAENAKRLFRIS